MEEVYENEELVNHRLVRKIRFENEKWYRNFYETKDEYNKTNILYRKYQLPNS